MSGADPIAVVAERITHRFGERIALDDVSFAVPRGRMLALLGPNGSGKSTLFRILATILRPTSGSASICGAPIAARPDAARRRLGVVFQRPAPLGIEEQARAPSFDVDARLPYQEARRMSLDAFERAYVDRILAANDGQVAKAAKAAGLHRVYFHRLLTKHGLRR